MDVSLSPMQAMLRELDRRILKQDALKNVLLYTACALSEAFAVSGAWIGLFRPEDLRCICAHSDGPSFPSASFNLAWVQGTPIDTLLCATLTDLKPQIHLPSDQNESAYAAIPLLVGGTLIGGIILREKNRTAFTAERTATLFSLADHIANSLSAARHLAKSRLLARALEASANAMIITDCNGIIQWVNSAFTRLTGYTFAESIGVTPRILKSDLNPNSLYQEMWQTILRGEVWTGELHNRRKDGSVYTEEMTVTPVRDEIEGRTHFIAVKEDISARKQQEAHVHFLAMHDPLTALLNRRSFMDRLKEVIADGQTGALLLLDLDNFKVINDTFGHVAGDQFLVSLSRVLTDSLRDHDVLARLGGDEFAVLMQRVSLNEAAAIADRLRVAVSQCRPTPFANLQSISISVGICPITAGKSAQELLSQADAALYRAKSQGRNRVVFVQATEPTELERVNQWISLNSDTLREQHLLLHFQPIVRLNTGQIEHAEALLRIRESDGTVLSAQALLGTTEQFGLVQEIDRWVVQKAIQSLLSDRRLRLFVNLSETTWGNSNLLQSIEWELKRHPQEAARIGFEITETALVNNMTAIEHLISKMHGLGCRFAVDDFGTACCPLSSWRHLSTDFIKIDGSFIRTLSEDRANQAIVVAVRTLAHQLNKEVIAEHVESADTASMLRDLGVTLGQGYFLGKPGPKIPTMT